MEYISLYCNYKLNKQIDRQSLAFLEGLRSTIDLTWIRLFNHEELQYVISGLRRKGFDVADLKQNVEYGGIRLIFFAIELGVFNMKKKWQEKLTKKIIFKEKGWHENYLKFYQKSFWNLQKRIFGTMQKTNQFFFKENLFSIKFFFLNEIFLSHFFLQRKNQNFISNKEGFRITISRLPIKQSNNLGFMGSRWRNERWRKIIILVIHHWLFKTSNLSKNISIENAY